VVRECCASALGTAIAGYLEDDAIVEVMLNPDGRLWIDRLSSGLTDTGDTLSAADGERIVRLVAHHVARRCMRARHACLPNYPGPVNVSKVSAAGCCGTGLRYPQARCRRIHSRDYVAAGNHDLRAGQRLKGCGRRAQRISSSLAARRPARRR